MAAKYSKGTVGVIEASTALEADRWLHFESAFSINAARTILVEIRPLKLSEIS